MNSWANSILNSVSREGRMSVLHLAVDDGGEIIMRWRDVWSEKRNTSNSQYSETKAAACRHMVEGVYLGIAAFFRGDPKYLTPDGHIIRPEQERWLISHLNDSDIPPHEVSLIIECFAKTFAVRAIDALIEFLEDESHSMRLRCLAAEAIALIDSEDHQKKLVERRNASTGELRALYDRSLNW